MTKFNKQTKIIPCLANPSMHIICEFFEFANWIFKSSVIDYQLSFNLCYHCWLIFFVGNKAKERNSKWMFQEKHSMPNFPKNNFSYPLICTRTCIKPKFFLITIFFYQFFLICKQQIINKNQICLLLIYIIKQRVLISKIWMFYFIFAALQVIFQTVAFIKSSPRVC